MNSEGHTFTPGPWSWSHRKIPGDRDGVYSTQIYDSAGVTIADASWYPIKGHRYVSTNRDANARLIAAAPDLLAALEECNTFLDDLTKPDAKASGSAIIASYANAVALNMKIGRLLSQARPKAEGGADV
ncbi:MAG: hypothetical protein J0G33_02865 [Afipia felis]|nr:hypothetical protein [Afipia felis]